MRLVDIVAGYLSLPVWAVGILIFVIIFLIGLLFYPKFMNKQKQEEEGK